MNKAVFILPIVIMAALIPRALATEKGFFRPKRIILSFENQSFSPSCNMYMHHKYPLGMIEYCVSKKFTIGAGLGHSSIAYDNIQNTWSLESNVFYNYKISGNSVKGILGVGLVCTPDFRALRTKTTLGIRVIIAQKISFFAKVFNLKTKGWSKFIGFSYGASLAF